MGPAWRNTANSLRAGFENLWIKPALDALERVVPIPEDDPDSSP
jgi:hypothetical protein